MTGLNLPGECGVMVLPNCTMFPQGGLPLCIFEERYRKMLSAALEGDCLFAVGRSFENADGNVGVSSVGTIGLIRACREKEDGTSDLFLHGILRVRFCEWMEDDMYPKARIEPLFSEPLMPKVDMAARKAMRGAVEDFLIGQPEALRMMVELLLEHCDEAGLMADLMADRLVRDGEERQRLLETIEVGERVSRLCGIFGG